MRYCFLFPISIGLLLILSATLLNAQVVLSDSIKLAIETEMVDRLGSDTELTIKDVKYQKLMYSVLQSIALKYSKEGEFIKAHPLHLKMIELDSSKSIFGIKKDDLGLGYLAAGKDKLAFEILNPFIEKASKGGNREKAKVEDLYVKSLIPMTVEAGDYQHAYDMYSELIKLDLYPYNHHAAILGSLLELPSAIVNQHFRDCFRLDSYSVPSAEEILLLPLMQQRSHFTDLIFQRKDVELKDFILLLTPEYLAGIPEGQSRMLIFHREVSMYFLGEKSSEFREDLESNPFPVESYYKDLFDLWTLQFDSPKREQIRRLYRSQY